MIKLRYTDATNPTGTTKEFRELALYEQPSVARVNATTLRGRVVSHRLHQRRVWSLVITTELAENDFDFLRAWWCADTQYIQRPYSASDINWIEVATEGGAFPGTFVDGCEDLPEVAFEITEKEPS